MEGDGGLCYWEIVGPCLEHGRILRSLQICGGSREAGRKVTCNISAFSPTKFSVNSGSTSLVVKLTVTIIL